MVLPGYPLSPYRKIICPITVLQRFQAKNFMYKILYVVKILSFYA
jgi:hypothetical protein